MAGLTVDNAVKSFGETRVLNGVSIALEEGEFCVIVGASGCGKSTLLRAIAGLEQLDSGEIHIAGRRVDQLPPAERGIAMVFQSYALYPHLSVFENLAFALRVAKRPAAEIDAAVRRAADILGLDELLDRKPAALSGGQRPAVQRDHRHQRRGAGLMPRQLRLIGGAAYRTRTCDPRITNAMLYQLS